MTPILGILASSFFQPTGDYQAIMTATVDSGGASSVTFSSIPSTYKHLQIRAIAKNTYTSSANYDNLTMQLNGDTSGNYTRHRLLGSGSSASALGLTGQTFTSVGLIPRSSGSETNMFGASVVDILDYANTSKYKTIRNLCGIDANGSGAVALQSGLWLNTAAITSITLATDLNNLAEYSQFALFGVK